MQTSEMLNGWRNGSESLRIRLAGGRYHGSRMCLIPGRGAGAPRPKTGFPQHICDYITSTRKYSLTRSTVNFLEPVSVNDVPMLDMFDFWSQPDQNLSQA